MGNRTYWYWKIKRTNKIILKEWWLINKVFLIGRLTNEPELRESQKGTKQTKFTVAVNRLKEGTDFINCIARYKTAELIGKYLHKGNQIALEGKIQTGSYEKDGKKVYTTDIIVTNLTFIGGAKKESDSWEGTPSTFKTDEIELTPDDYPF